MRLSSFILLTVLMFGSSGEIFSQVSAVEKLESLEESTPEPERAGARVIRNRSEAISVRIDSTYAGPEDSKRSNYKPIPASSDVRVIRKRSDLMSLSIDSTTAALKESCRKDSLTATELSSSTAGEGRLHPDSLTATERGSISEMRDGYLADSVAIAAPDTSYFTSGDPELNLVRAAEFGQMEVVKMLVERGIDVDASSYEGVTPLMYAAQNGDIKIINYLIGKGADVNARPENKVTALMGAVRTEQYEAVDLLLASGARVDAKDEYSLTPLMHAAAYNYPGIIGALVDSGANMEAGDWNGTRPLMMASYYNCIEAADVLLDKGADADGRDKFGFTPLMVAVQHGDYHMAWLLLDRGADPALKNEGGLHAMALAVMQGDEDMVELLAESGADINQQINASTNALDIARESKDEAITEFLKLNGAKPSRKPEISELRGGIGMNFNADDFMVGFEAGVSENKYKLYMTSGFIMRPSAVRILRPENDTLSYQYWERRFIWPLSLGREFTIASNEDGIFLLRLHMCGALTWGSYRGASTSPDTKYLLVPGGGLAWRKGNLGISFDYQYFPVKVFDIAHHRFTLALNGFYDFRPRVRYTHKEIKWF